MELGIVVVYLVSEDNEKLLEIHLDKINKNTTSRFKVYAGTNMLSPRFVKKLNQYDFVKTINCDQFNGPNEDNRGAKEHSHYLEQLIKIAIKDGVSHVAIMHPDSFPIKVGWEKYLTNKLSESYVLASIFPTMSGCTFFNREFYIKYKPKLLPTVQEESSTSWFNFQKTNQAVNLVETGMGYGFKTYLEDTNWYKLEKSNRGEYHSHFGSIFDDIVFHLGSASEYKNRPLKGYVKNSIFHNLKQIIVDVLPVNIKEKFKSIIPFRILYPEAKQNKIDFLKVREALLNETEEFLNFLRNGDNSNLN